MASILENKNHLLKSYNTLKELYRFEFANEENILRLLNQLSEFVYREEREQKNSKEFQAYRTNILTQELRRDRDKAVGKITLHSGHL
jgi:hypothetical protein